MKLPFTIYDLRFTICRKSSESVSVNRQSSIINHKFPGAFTLIELLVVISILGLLAGLAVPALKNLGKSDANVGATQQLLDDIGRSRQLAINNHAKVFYMVFVPTNFFNLPCVLNNTPYPDLLTGLNNIALAADKSAALTALTNLVDKQLSGYNFISLGEVGDQPGNHQWRYLAPWQNLPAGTFIAAQKFLPPSASFAIPQWTNDYPNVDNWRGQSQVYAFTNALVPFPTEKSPSVLMPCIAFDYSGRLVSENDGNDNYHDAYIPLAHGSVSFGVDPSTKTPQPTAVNPGDITEVPPGNSTSISYNVIHIYALTGRAVLEFHKVQ